ncbi:hypothetical protein L3Q82_015552, partial [Scortum barcoo]
MWIDVLSLTGLWIHDVDWPPAVSHGSLCPRGVKTERRTENCQD